MKQRYTAPVHPSEEATTAALKALRQSPEGKALASRLDRKHARISSRGRIEQAAKASRIKLDGGRGVRCLSKAPDPEAVHLIRELKPAWAAGLRSKLEE